MRVFRYLLLFVVIVTLVVAFATTGASANNTTAPKGNGFYLVGSEIAPGKWRSTGGGRSCYWARSDNRQNIYDNHFGLAGGTVNVRAGDYEVEFDDCGTFIYVENEPRVLRPDAAANKWDGFFTVGVEIAPGRWRSTGTRNDCYWARLDGNQDILDNHFGQAGGTLTILPGDYEVEFNDCGTWTYLDAPPQSAATPTPTTAAGPGGGCVIPPTGPWPPCARGGNAGGAATPVPSLTPPSGACVIPPSGPWPPCARGGNAGGGAAPAPSPTPSGGACVIPPSGPWPPCARGGNAGGGAAPVPSPASGPAARTFSGSGDDVVMVNRTRQFQLARITGNSCSRHFAVWSINSDLEHIDLLANTTDPHSGVVLIDVSRDDTAAGFEVSASCNWSITLLPITDARLLTKPGTIGGSNDDVVAVQAGGVLNVRGNQADRYFSLIAFGAAGQRLDLLVNTTDPYSGNVVVPGGTRYLQISAVGGWTLTYP